MATNVRADDTLDPRDPYLVDRAGIQARIDATLRRRSRPKVSLDDLLDIEESPYVTYAEGMTRRPRVEQEGSEAALGSELRPGFVAFLMRRLEQPDDAMARQVIERLLTALRAQGTQQRKWALALRRKLITGLDQGEIARELGVSEATVSRYIGHAMDFAIGWLREQEWVQIYLQTDAAPRYHINLEEKEDGQADAVDTDGTAC